MPTETAPCEILTPGTHLYRAGAPLRPDAAVVMLAQGRYRVARVVKVGPKRTTVAFATSGTAYREKTVPHGDLYVLDANAPNAAVTEREDAPYVVRQHGAGVGSRGRIGGHYLEGD